MPGLCGHGRVAQQLAPRGPSADAFDGQGNLAAKWTFFLFFSFFRLGLLGWIAELFCRYRTYSKSKVIHINNMYTCTLLSGSVKLFADAPRTLCKLRTGRCGLARPARLHPKGLSTS